MALRTCVRKFSVEAPLGVLRSRQMKDRRGLHAEDYVRTLTAELSVSCQLKRIFSSFCRGKVVEGLRRHES